MKLTKTTFIVLDTETTNKEDAKPIEIAACKYIYKAPLKTLEFKETLINPECKIHPAAMAVHHITNEDVKDAPLLKNIEQEWQEWIGDSIIIAYNSDFDQEVLSNTSLYNNTWFDAYRMAMHFWSLNELNKDGFPLTSLQQQELRYWMDLPSIKGEAHRACADVQITCLIMNEAIKKYLECGNEDNLNSFIDYVNSPIMHKTFPVGGKGMAGLTPTEVPDWALRNAFDKEKYWFDTFKKFNIQQCLIPEYIRRFGREPYFYKENNSKKDITTEQKNIKQRHSFQPKNNQTLKKTARKTNKSKWAR